MAGEQDLELEVNKDAETGGKSKKKLIIILLLVLVLLAGGGGAAFFLLMGDNSDKDKDDTQTTTEQTENPEKKSSEETAAEGDASAAESTPKASYIELDPAFVISYQVGSRARFLQLKLELMTYKPQVSEAIKANMPMLRNTIVMLMGQQDFAKLRTKEGRENLPKIILEALNKALKEETSISGIDAVLFTDYVMQ